MRHVPQHAGDDPGLGCRTAVHGRPPHSVVRQALSERQVSAGDEGGLNGKNGVDERTRSATNKAPMNRRRTWCRRVYHMLAENDFRSSGEGQPIVKTGAPDRIRTCDLCLRRAALYPAELRVLRPRPGTRVAGDGFIADDGGGINRELAGNPEAVAGRGRIAVFCVRFIFGRLAGRAVDECHAGAGGVSPWTGPCGSARPVLRVRALFLRVLRLLALGVRAGTTWRSGPRRTRRVRPASGSPA